MARHVTLKGSEKTAHPLATVVGSRNPNERFQVTVVVRNDGDYQPIMNFARKEGFEVKYEHGSVKLFGTAAQYEHAFDVKLGEAKFEDGSSFRSRVPHGKKAASIGIPAELEDHVLAVLGLDNRPFARPYIHMGPRTTTPLTPQQAASLYNYPDNDGSGHNIGILSLGGGYSNTDLTLSGIDPSRVKFISIDGAGNQYTGNPGSADGENILDLTVIGQGTKLGMGFFCGPNADNGMYDIAAAILADPTMDCGSCSWGAPATDWTGQAKAAWNQLMASATKPFFSASGDGGPNDGTNAPIVDFPAASVGPGAIGVGGTRLSFNGNNPAETMWNSSNGGASGGGFSTDFNKPAWQLGSFAMRGVPDIALQGDPATGYEVVIGGKKSGPWGGTSAAAPMAARGYALLVAVTGKQQMPFASLLYAHPEAFNKVTSGIAGEYGVPGQAAGAGLGSFNLKALIQALGAPTPPVNNPPTETIRVDITAEASTVQAGQTVQVTAEVSGVPVGNFTSFAWKANGGTVTGSGPTVGIVFDNPGSFVVSCTVTDSVTNASGGASVTFTVNVATPPANIGPMEQFGQFVIDASVYIENHPAQAKAQASLMASSAQAWMSYFKYVDSLIPGAQSNDETDLIQPPDAPVVPKN